MFHKNNVGAIAEVHGCCQLAVGTGRRIINTILEIRGREPYRLHVETGHRESGMQARVHSKPRTHVAGVGGLLFASWLLVQSRG